MHQNLRESVISYLWSLRGDWIDPRELKPYDYGRYAYSQSSEVVKKLREMLSRLPEGEYAFGIRGSFGRGEGGPRSDLDIICVSEDQHSPLDLKTWQYPIIDYVSASLSDVKNYTPERKKFSSEPIQGMLLPIDPFESVWMVYLTGDTRLLERYSDAMAKQFNKYDEFKDIMSSDRQNLARLSQDGAGYFNLEQGIAIYRGSHIGSFKIPLTLFDATIGNAVLRGVEKGYEISNLVTELPLPLDERLLILRDAGLIHLPITSIEELTELHHNLLRLYHTSQYVYARFGQTEIQFPSEEARKVLERFVSLCKEIETGTSL